MTAKHIKSRLSLTAITAIIVTAAMLVGVSGAQAATPPVKQVISSHFGAKVNATTGGNVCSVESGDTCQAGLDSAIPGGFAYLSSVAVDNDSSSPEYGDVYVADRQNDRVQVLTATGEFVLMFGTDVNETTGGNTCTAKEIKNTGVKCKTGVEGSATGQLGANLYSIAIDPDTGDVYVAELSSFTGGSPASSTRGKRVQEFTPTGQFVLELGKEVNETTKGNLCTEEEVEHTVAKCTSPALLTNASAEADDGHGAFNFEEVGDLLAVGGPAGLLYVGDEHRVQEFNASTGVYVGEISLTSIPTEREQENRVRALAVDDEPASPEYGDVYLVYRTEHVIGLLENGEPKYEAVESVIRKFTSAGVEVDDVHFPLTLSPREASAEVSAFAIRGIAVDSSGRLAVSELEGLDSGGFRSSGSLLEGATGRLITEFALPGEAKGLVFGGADELFAAVRIDQEVVAYRPVPVAELLSSAVPCAAGAEHESDLTFSCTLNGEANPEGVSGTEAWFQWGTTPVLGSETARHPVATGGVLVSVEPAPVLEGLRPNATYHYRVAAYDANVKAPESPLSSETASFATPFVAPRVVGAPSTPFVRSASVVFSGELDPENANTKYGFQYGACEDLEACSGVLNTTTLQSALYAKIGATVEATGLQPGTTYHYRLVAESENTAKTAKDSVVGPEESFTTGPAPVVEAFTGQVSAVTSTSAVISGTANPSGQQATYAFELGVYNGADTRYGVVSSGPAGAGSTPVQEELALTGLQPGTMYSYRIVVKSGYGTAEGAPVMFTTVGLPEVLVSPASLPLLAVPAFAFPAPVVAPATKTKPVPKKAKKKPNRKSKKGKDKNVRKARKSTKRKTRR